MDYLKDEIAVECLELAQQSKAKVGFGALLFDARGNIAGRGRNRRSVYGENDLLGGGVDYAAHAEQAAAIDAIKKGASLADSQIYVLGRVMRGEQKGFLSIRHRQSDTYFSCVRCAKMFVRFGISVSIPLPKGWHQLSAEEALQSATFLKKEGKRLQFSPI